MPASRQDLALARAEAAERLEAAIARLGDEYTAYVRATTALEAHTQQDLARYLEVPLNLALVKAGLGAFLERRLTGTTGSLRATVEQQHAKIGIE